jgi:hypothetical protein
MLLRNQPVFTNTDDVMMATPQKKRLKNEAYLSSLLETPSYLSEVYLPTEMEKLRKLFPLLDARVSTS